MRTWLLLGVLGFTACVSTQATRLGTAQIRPAVSPDKVAIYRNAAQVQGKYEEVALLTSTGNYQTTDEEGMYKSMREKAGKMGANGIILESIADPGTGGKVASAVLGVGGDRKGKALAIFVFPDSTQKR